MTAPEIHCPPPALAPGRPRQPRTWPYAARTDNDFLRMLPEPALTAEAPPAKPRPAAGPEREALTAVEALALAPLNRTYWFDL